MPADLISKKELLARTGISYGQLYRWKRKNLIPEEWFIRKSTFTGQETFFPRCEILLRVERIKALKDDVSLDALADLLSPRPADVRVAVADLAQRHMVSPQALDLFAEFRPDARIMRFGDLLGIYAADRALASGDLSGAEAGLILRTVAAHVEQFEDRPCEVVFTRKRGTGQCWLVPAAAEIYVDDGSTVAFRLPLAPGVETISMHLP